MNESLGGYDYRVVENQKDIKVKYEIVDEFGNEFLVVFRNDTVGPSFKPMLGTSYELTYFAKDPETGEWSIDAIVSTNVYKLMKTIFGDVRDTERRNVLSDFLETRQWVSVIRLEGLAKDGELGITKRTKLYLRHLRNNPLPGFRVEEVSANRINLVKNKI